MKKLSYVILAAFAVYALQGCSGGTKSTQTDSVTTKDSTTKVVTKTDSVKVDSADAKFAITAAGGGMAEIQLSSLAQQKTSNTNIKGFAAMMVKDHSAAGDSLAAIAKKKGIALPSTLDAAHQKKYDDLNKLSGAAFDKAYVDVMISDHGDALKLMQDAATNCKDADLKAFAGKTAPVVQAHLDAINKIKDSMK